MFKTVSSYTAKKLELSSEDTYCIIFGIFQDSHIQAFHDKYDNDINILFEDKAVNGAPEHPGDNSLRQHIIIFEKK